MATSRTASNLFRDDPLAQVPAHRNRESNGYWDFWQKQALIPGQDTRTICGLAREHQGKLDDDGGEYAGQIMGYLNDATAGCATGAICARSATVRGFRRLPRRGAPHRCSSRTFPRGIHLVFEHGPFDYEQECRTVRRRSRRRCAASTTPLRAAPSTRRRPGASPTFTSIPGSISSTSAREAARQVKKAPPAIGRRSFLWSGLHPFRKPNKSFFSPAGARSLR